MSTLIYCYAEQPKSVELPTVSVINVGFQGAQLQNGIYVTNSAAECLITADMIPPFPELVIPSGQVRMIVQQIVAGSVSGEIPFMATIAPATEEEPARLHLPIRLPAGFYMIGADRQNAGLANPKIAAPFRLQFDALDIDCLPVW